MSNPVMSAMLSILDCLLLIFSGLGGDQSSLMLRKAVRDFIVIAVLADEDVHFYGCASWSVECSHRDRDSVAVRRLPE